jgi:hypothetical protein
MCVPDALSRNPVFPTTLDSSLEEEDPYFQYVQEDMKPARLSGG